MKKQDRKNLLDKFYQEISQIKQRFDSIGVTSKTVASPEFTRVVIDLKKLLSRVEFFPVIGIIQKDKKIIKLAEDLREIYSRYYSYQENKTALDIILAKSKNQFISNNIMLGEREIEVSKVDGESHVFFIGSGPFPWTSINYAISKGCKVTCIDKDPDAVAVSKQLVRKLELDALIDIFCANAQNFCYSQATHVVIAAMVKFKAAVLKQIKDTSKQNVKIIIRSSFGPYFFIYERIDQKALKNFKIIKTVSAGENSELISYILSKNKK